MNIHTQIEQLEQLKTVTFDGDLVSKSARDFLVKNDLAIRLQGWNIISAEGVEMLVKLGALKP